MGMDPISLTAIAGLTSAAIGGGSSIYSMITQRKEKKKAKKEQKALAASEAEERKKRYARLTATGASESGSILSTGGNTTGSAVQRKELLGQ